MSGYLSSGPYGPGLTRRQHQGRRYLEMTVASAVIACVAAAVLIVAVRFRPAQYSLCQAYAQAVLCVTAATPPAMPIPATYSKPATGI